MLLEIFGFCIGILYLWWEYQADSKVWLASVIMPMISMWIYYSKGLYADFGINIYYLVIAVYGFWNWTRKSRNAQAATVSSSSSEAKKRNVLAADSVDNLREESEDVPEKSEDEDEKPEGADEETEGDSGKKAKELPVSHTPAKVWIGVLVVAALLWWFIHWILVTFTDSTVPVADAFTTALSIVGLWMMAKKYAEQWLIWLVVDLVCSCLYWYKGIPFYSVLYAIYTVISWFGYRKWVGLIPATSN